MAYEVRVTEANLVSETGVETGTVIYAQRFEDNPLERVILALNRPPRRRRKKSGADKS